MKGVFAKLAVLQLIGGVFGVAVLYFIMDIQLSRRMNESYVSHGKVVAQSLAKAVEPALVGGDLTTVQSSLDAILASPDVEWACVTSNDGEILAHTLVPQFPASISVGKIPSDNDGELITMPGTGEVVTVFTQPVLTGIVGKAHVAFSRRKITSAIHTMEWIVLACVSGVMLTITLGFALLARRIISPIRVLTDAAGLLGGNQRSAFQEVPVRSDDEIGILTKTFNKMALEIRDHQDSLESRVRERTHELVRANENLASEVSERKRIENELATSNSAFRELFAASPEAIVTLDLEGIVQSWSPAAERLFGWTAQDAVGRLLPSVPIDGQDEFRERLRRAAKGEDLSAQSVRRLKRDGSEVEINVSTAVLRDALGNTTGLMSIITDITQRKRDEVELIKAKEVAEAANRAKSEFLANMSHEIRTPMNGIIGMTDLVLETELNPEQTEYLEMVKGSADSLLTIINDILDFSKIEAGKLELDVLRFDLRKSLGELFKILALKAQQKGLEFIFDVPPVVPASIVGDSARLRQILVNLIGNAIKFTEHGEVEVSVRIEEQDVEETLLRFSVRDTGIGIPVNKQEQIFDAFSQDMALGH